MQSILVNKKDSFIFYFYNISMKIEREDIVTKEVFYKEVLVCQHKKGKQQLLATLLVTIISLFSPDLVPRKIFKVHDQLLIELKDSSILSYQLGRDIDEYALKKVMNYIKQRIQH
jgi:hypothetical protein